MVNVNANAEIAARAAAAALGVANVLHDFPPSTAGEEGCLHHGPRFDFNDSALPVGAAFWARLVETELPVT